MHAAHRAFADLVNNAEASEFGSDCGNLGKGTVCDSEHERFGTVDVHITDWSVVVQTDENHGGGPCQAFVAVDQRTVAAEGM